MIQAHILYSGRVQGVGFRYTVHHYAKAYNFDGWVKNLPNGQVEMLVEGSKDEIHRLCAQIDQQFDGYIREKQISFSAPIGTLGVFTVAH